MTGVSRDAATTVQEGKKRISVRLVALFLYRCLRRQLTPGGKENHGTGSVDADQPPQASANGRPVCQAVSADGKDGTRKRTGPKGAKSGPGGAGIGPVSVAKLAASDERRETADDTQEDSKDDEYDDDTKTAELQTSPKNDRTERSYWGCCHTASKTHRMTTTHR